TRRAASRWSAWPARPRLKAPWATTCSCVWRCRRRTGRTWPACGWSGRRRRCVSSRRGGCTPRRPAGGRPPRRPRSRPQRRPRAGGPAHRHHARGVVPGRRRPRRSGGARSARPARLAGPTLRIRARQMTRTRGARRCGGCAGPGSTPGLDEGEAPRTGINTRGFGPFTGLLFGLGPGVTPGRRSAPGPAGALARPRPPARAPRSPPLPHSPPLPLFLPAPAAARADGADLARVVGPYLDDGTLAVAHIDLARLNPDDIAEALVEVAGLDRRDLQA